MALIFRNLEQSEERFRLIAETSIDLIFQLDPSGRLAFCSPAARQYGFKPEEIIGTDFGNYISPEDLDLAQGIFQRVLQGESLKTVELRLKKADGSMYYAEINVSPIVTSHGIAGLQGISRDVDVRRENEKKLQALTMELQTANTALQFSRQEALRLMQDALEARAAVERTNQDLQREMEEHKGAEEQIKASLMEKEVLLREIHHRVKNNLQVISSLISLQTDNLNDHRLNEVFGDVRDRVRTMALVHEKLYESGSLSRLNVADYVASLLHYLMRSHGTLEKNIVLYLNVAPAELPIVTAVPCGLIINELVVNALKHAFANSNSGELTVSLQPVPETAHVCLRVRDNGSGLPEGFDWRQCPSLGLQLVRILTRQLHGTVEAESDKGTEFIVIFPVKEYPHE
jgi:PAS domain S-box-containing protein